MTLAIGGSGQPTTEGPPSPTPLPRNDGAIARAYRMLAGIYELSDSPSRVLPMEGVRGLAVILVFFVHFHAMFQPYLIQPSTSFLISEFLSSIGHSGVDLFFVLSGYLIYSAVIRKPLRYRTFMLRRMERIYPAFLVVLGTYLVLSFVFPAASKLPKGLVPASLYVLENAALLPGIFAIRPIVTVAWTLSYEFFYYLTIPLVVSGLRMRSWSRPSRVAFFTALACTVLCLALIDYVPRIRLVMFVAGILLWEALDSRDVARYLTRTGEGIVWLVLVSSFALMYALDPSVGTDPAAIDKAITPPRVVVMFVAFFAFGLYCFGRRGTFARLFSWAPLRWLGNMSYSYYLVHGLTLKALGLLMIWTLRPTTLNAELAWGVLPVCFAATLVTSTFLFVLVEKPFSLRPHGIRRGAETA
jgi:exopolysaccharide production protein ExoZ